MLIFQLMSKNESERAELCQRCSLLNLHGGFFQGACSRLNVGLCMFKVLLFFNFSVSVKSYKIKTGRRIDGSRAWHIFLVALCDSTLSTWASLFPSGGSRCLHILSTLELRTILLRAAHPLKLDQKDTFLSPQHLQAFLGPPSCRGGLPGLFPFTELFLLSSHGAEYKMSFLHHPFYITTQKIGLCES